MYIVRYSVYVCHCLFCWFSSRFLHFLFICRYFLSVIFHITLYLLLSILLSICYFPYYFLSVTFHITFYVTFQVSILHFICYLSLLLFVCVFPCYPFPVIFPCFFPTSSPTLTPSPPPLSPPPHPHPHPPPPPPSPHLACVSGLSTIGDPGQMRQFWFLSDDGCLVKGLVSAANLTLHLPRRIHSYLALQSHHPGVFSKRGVLEHHGPSSLVADKSFVYNYMLMLQCIPSA